MNKKQRNILLFVILVTSLGLVAAQAVWVLGVSEGKINQFEASVNNGLNMAVNEISNEETITQIIDQLPNKVAASNDSSQSERHATKQGIQYISRNQKVVDQEGIDSLSQQMPNFAHDSGLVRFLQQGGTPRGTMPSKGIVKRFLVEQIIERLIMLDVPIEQRVTIEQLDTMLRKELLQSQVSLHYELAVCDENKEVLMSSELFDPSGSDMLYEKRLFPNDPDDLISKYYVQVYFPRQSNHLFRELIPFILTSLMLVGLVISVFGYTLYVIFRQKKISEIKNDFISNITHELKTPIATISLAAQMMDDSSVADGAKNIPQLSAMIKGQSKHLIFLVEKVLQSSVFEKGIFTMKLAPESINGLITEAVNNLSLQLQNKKAVTTLTLKAAPDTLMVDKSYLLNAISNLIDNAMKYCPGALDLHISTENKDNGVLMTIADNGMGIDKMYHTKIFDQFFRVPSGNVHNVKGFGLGLSYVKKIVDAHKGHIRIESKLGKGTQFLIWLPLHGNTE